MADQRHPLCPLAIQDLLAQPEGYHWQVDQHLDQLATLTPVRGSIRAVAEGPLLRVEGEATTTVQLRCDRCLQPYEHQLEARASERIALGTASGDLEEALAFDAEGISEQLDPTGSFDPEQWLYEQLSLQQPLVCRCGPGCAGPACWGTEDPALDPRWAALRRLQP
jgi:uncharacterized protein